MNKQQQKSTTVDLVAELADRNQHGLYNAIISKARSGDYHDFKSNAATPKFNLVQDLRKHPELQDLWVDVMNGEYDEVADEQDQQQLWEKLVSGGVGDTMFEFMNLPVPTQQDRERLFKPKP